MPFDLERFVTAQAPVYDTVREELVAGRKGSHWMWFVFPQLRALGRSPTARLFGLEGLDEAAAYWQHPMLGSRLRECAQLVLAVRGRSVHQIFGSPDDLKLLSCLTLFAEVEQAKGDGVFDRAIRQYYGGQPDQATLELLAKAR